MNILNVENITKSYKLNNSKNKIFALDDVSFKLQKGSVLGVIGPNGSGKTTLFKTILKFIKSDSGSVQLFGNELSTQEVRRKIGFLNEKVHFYPELTAQELLRFYAGLYNIKKDLIDNKVKEILKTVELTNVPQRIKGFSKGMTQRLGLAAALIGDPELIILDEPSSGLDAFGITIVTKIIKRLVDEGKTIIMASHVLTRVEDLCTHLLVLYKGKKLYYDDIRKAGKILDQYRIDLNSTLSPEAIIEKINSLNIGVVSVTHSSDLELFFIDLIRKHNESSN